MDNLSINDISFSPKNAELENNWRRLCDKMPPHGLSMTYTWFKSSAESCLTFSLKTNLLEIKDEDTDKVVGLIPYTKKAERIYHFFDVSSIYLMHLYQEYGDHYGLLIDPEYYLPTIKLLAAWIKKNDFDLCFMNNMHVDMKITSLIRFNRQLPLLTLINQKIPISCIWLPTESKYKEWSTGRFQRITRYKRKLEKSFEVEYCKIEKQTEIPDLLHHYQLMHSARFNNKGTVSSVCSDPIQFHFLERLVYNAFEAGILMGNYTKLNGKIASVEISFRLGTKLFAYTAAFDETYAKFRIGSIQTLVMLEKAVAHGIDVIDLLQGDEGYKRHWSQSINFDFNLLLFPKTFYGYFLFFVTLFRVPLRHLYQTALYLKAVFMKVVRFYSPREVRV